MASGAQLVVSRFVLVLALAAAALIIGGGAADAAAFKPGPESPLWLRVFAYTLLWSHIGGGAIGMISGVVAVFAPKGGRVHRIAGTVFFIAMLIAYAVGAGVAPFLDEGQRTNFAAGVMALYLLLSGWWTMKRRSPAAGVFEVVGLVLALSVVAAGVYLIWLASQSPSGTVDNSPPQAFILFAVVGAFAALGEFHVLVRGRIIGASRLARHLWRMSVSWFIASGSFFLGQPNFQPDWFRETPAPLALSFAPLILMVFFLVWIRLRRRHFGRVAPVQATPSTG